jgi:hypothetical protein
LYSLNRQGNRCYPFVATVDGHFAGFALADDAIKAAETGNWMDQFFVLKNVIAQLRGNKDWLGFNAAEMA